VPVEVDGSAIGTLDIYSNLPWDWDDSEIAALQTYAGLTASLLTAAVTAQVKGRLADQLQAALEQRWLIEQAKGMVMGREGLDAQAAFERLRGRPGPRAGGWWMWPGRSPPASRCQRPIGPSQDRPHGTELTSSILRAPRAR
jgi:ANTAR domain